MVHLCIIRHEIVRCFYFSMNFSVFGYKQANSDVSLRHETIHWIRVGFVYVYFGVRMLDFYFWIDMEHLGLFKMSEIEAPERFCFFLHNPHFDIIGKASNHCDAILAHFFGSKDHQITNLFFWHFMHYLQPKSKQKTPTNIRWMEHFQDLVLVFSLLMPTGDFSLQYIIQC